MSYRLALAFSIVIYFAFHVFQVDGAAPALITDPAEVYGKSLKPEVYLIGKFDPSADKDLFTFVSSRGQWIRKEAHRALNQMLTDFLKAHKSFPGPISRESLTRNMAAQADIWNKKWKTDPRATPISDSRKRALKILEFSAMPGSSRHHWGTDVDIFSVNPALFRSGNGLILYQWLQKNAATYGFCQPYTAYERSQSPGFYHFSELRSFLHRSGRSGGYLEERWHWSYKPLSSQMLKDWNRIYNNAEGFKKWQSSVVNFSGKSAIADLATVAKYVNTINEACK